MASPFSRIDIEESQIGYRLIFPLPALRKLMFPVE
jgi:hypothetical protein